MALVVFRRWCCLVSAISLFGFVGNLGAGECYYLLMFGSQRIPNQPNYAHTFATFVKVTWPGDGPCPGDAALEAHTISWLPANLHVRTGAVLPECGHNFDLQETLRFVIDSEERVSLWGPYRVEPELFDKALRQKAALERGNILYKANDMGYRSNRVSNCIHAVSTIVEGAKLRVASPGFGEIASYAVLRKMERYALSKQPEPWVGSALGLDEYPIHYRDYQSPYSGGLFGPIFRLFGGERGLHATYGPPLSSSENP